MNVVYPPTLDFTFMRQRPQQLMLQFARHGHQVFYCNYTQEEGRQPERVASNLFAIHDHRQFVNSIIPLLAPTLVWCSWAKLHSTIDSYMPGTVVFDSLDDFPEWRRYEDEMVARADAVVATTRTLLLRLKKRHRRVRLVPNLTGE